MHYQIWTKLALVGAAALLTVVPAVGAATQMDATDDPEVSGPLELSSDDCRSQKETDDAGVVIARGKSCLRIYSYSPASETDTQRNYGVVWLQSNVDARAGWCASLVRSDIDLPGVIDVESKAPPSMDIGRRKVYETALTTDAAGTGTEEASVRQSQILYPKLVRTTINDDTNVYRLKWRGLRDAKLGFASGVEVSWPVEESPRTTFRLTYELKRGNC